MNKINKKTYIRVNTDNDYGTRYYYPSIFIKLFYLFLFVIPLTVFIFVSILGLIVWEESSLIIKIIFWIVAGYICFIYPFIDVYGRLLIIRDGKIIQREKFVFYDEVEISKIKKCYIKTGVNVRERRGAITLRIEHEGGIMDINAAYYSAKDLKEITELIGFPDVIKK